MELQKIDKNVSKSYKELLERISLRYVWGQAQAVRVILFFFITCIIGNINAQQRLIINPEIRLPKDSIESARLVSALNEFLLAAQQPNEENTWIFPRHTRLETYILLDEFKNINLDSSGNDFFKPYLTNVIETYGAYLLQISYIGTNNNIPLLRASFEILAVKNQDSFLFASPLYANTHNWKRSEIGQTNLDGNYHKIKFYYQDYIEEKNVDKYVEYIIEFDKKLQSPIQKADIYVCGNLVEALKLIGIDYKIDYNGHAVNELCCVSGDQEIIVQGLNNREYFQKFDLHDLFHARASNAIPEAKRNHYMICGCAYVYGGSWGISWEDIQRTFKTRMKYNNTTDWLKLYFDRYNFGESQAKHLLVTQFVNALIVQKIEKEQGFPAVIELLSSGNMYKDRKNFFKILEKVTGINEKNFNKEVGKLIKTEI